MSSYKIKCVLHCCQDSPSRDGVDLAGDTTDTTLTFRADEKKKSVFWLGNSPLDQDRNNKDNHEPQSEKGEFFRMNDPAEAIISLSPGQDPWAVGGFQLVSNSREIQVYLTKQDGQEAYLTTVKGLPVALSSDANSSSKDKASYKALCAIPGGPRPVLRARLVFHKLDTEEGNNNNAVMKLQWIKLTARLIDASSVTQNQSAPMIHNNPQMKMQQMEQMRMMQEQLASFPVAKSSNVPKNNGSGLSKLSTAGLLPNPTNNNNNNESPATASDVGAAMAGLNFSVRSAEDRILKQVQESQKLFQEQMAQQQRLYMANLQQMFQQQQLWMEERLQRQHESILAIASSAPAVGTSVTTSVPNEGETENEDGDSENREQTSERPQPSQPQEQEQHHPQETRDSEQDTNGNRHVCLFGLSGDPPTGTAGHVGIVQQLLQLEKMPSLDEIRVLPVYRHTFSEKQQRLVSYEHRLDMCRLAFGACQNETSIQVEVSSAEYDSWKRWVDKQGLPEEDMSACVGTAALLEYLIENEPDTTFHFCLGADSFTSLMEGKWKESDRVLELIDGRFLVLSRISSAVSSPQDSNNNATNESDQRQELERLVQSVPNAILLPPNTCLGNVSSSYIRELLQSGTSEEQQVLNDEALILHSVLSYIRQHELYGAS